MSDTDHHGKARRGTKRPLPRNNANLRQIMRHDGDTLGAFEPTALRRTR